jgi:hypothetical protein
MMFNILFLVQIATGNASLESIQGARNGPRGLNIFDANGGEETSHIGTEDGLELKREIVGRSLRRASSMTYKAVLKKHLWGRVTVYTGLITYILYLGFYVIPSVITVIRIQSGNVEETSIAKFLDEFQIVLQIVKAIYHISTFILDIFALIHGTTLFRVISAIHIYTSVLAAITHYVWFVYSKQIKDYQSLSSFATSTIIKVHVWTERTSYVSDFIHSIVATVVPIVFLWRGKK